MRRTITIAATLAFVIAMAWACNQAGPPPTPTNEKQPGMTTIAVADTCVIDPGEFEIAPDTAIAWMKNWKNLGVTIPGMGDTVFLGFHIPQCELQSLVTTLNDTLEVWAMLAVEKKSGYSELKLIFQSENGSPRVPHYDYFDFTTPCPNTCPPEKE